MVRKIFLFLSFIFLAISTVALAQTFGSWYVDTSHNDGLYAATINDSGEIFGQFCYPSAGSCIWFLGMKTACEKNAPYPVLANSDIGSWQLQLLCDGPIGNGVYRYAFSDFDTVDALVRKGTRVGFAVPLQSDQFLVSRFLLDGATKAITDMRAAAQRKTLPAPSGTRDQVM